MKLDIQLFADGKVVIETKLDTTGFENDLDDMENSSKLSQIIGSIKEKFTSIGTSIGNAIKKAGTGIKSIAKAVISVGSIIVKTMAKVVLSAIGFGVALMTALGIIALLGLAFLSVMEAAKKVGEENAELKANIQYIIFALKTALQPIIDAIANAIVKIINFLITIFKYVALIVNAIAGRNLFAKATHEAFAKSMKDANKNSKGVAKNAKEIKKQLAGFDEMNVLQDNTASGGSGGATAKITAPTIDWSNLDLENKPKWVQKIEEHFEKIRKEWNKLKGGLGDDIKKFFLVDEIQDAIKRIGPEWETFTGNVKNDWQDAKTKISNHFTELKTNWESAKAGIAASLTDLKGNMIEKWNNIKASVSGVVDSIKEKWTAIKQWFTEKVITPLQDNFNAFKEKIVGIWTAIKDKATSIFTTIKTFITDKIVKPITDKFNSFKTTITDIFNKIRDALKGPINTMIGWINKLIDGINKISIKVPAWVNKAIGNGNKESTWGFNIKKIPKLAKGGIINQPGRGTPIAIGGERGAEAVIPLTDNQQMQLLGEAIGRYITINANITNSMNGRIISRELQKINNENSFAGNR